MWLPWEWQILPGTAQMVGKLFEDYAELPESNTSAFLGTTETE